MNVNESPQNIQSSSWKLETREKSKQILQFLQRKKKQVDEYKGTPVYKSGSYFFTEHEGRLTYLMKFKIDKIKSVNMPYATQTLVWRLGGGYVTGIASYIFWNHLFPIKHIVMTDGQQTPQGKTFWIDRIGEAIKNNYFVYRIDVRQGKIMAIDDVESAFSGDNYGDDKIFKLYRLVISRENLLKN